MVTQSLDLTPMEHAVLMALVGLAVAVMQGDEERGPELVKTLTQPGVEAVAKSITEKLADMSESEQ
jgi:hypothetical protein